MKRFTLSAITLAFIAYLLIVASTQNLLGINQFKYFSNKIHYGRRLTGIGALFTREATLVNYQTLYKTYQDGKWSNWHLLEQETFRNYTNNGSISEQRHTHLDSHLTKDLYFGPYKNGKDVRHSIQYKTLISHLNLGHLNNQVPDSIKLVFQQKDIDTNGKYRFKNLLYLNQSL